MRSGIIAFCTGWLLVGAAMNAGAATAEFTGTLRLRVGTLPALTISGQGSAQVTADACARKGMEHGLQKVEVFVKGPGSGRETAIRSLQAAGLEILGIKDVTPQAHNGVRPKKRRRV